MKYGDKHTLFLPRIMTAMFVTLASYTLDLVRFIAPIRRWYLDELHGQNG